MDTKSGFLKGLSGLVDLARPSSDLSPRDKRYLSLVEKALASFDSLEEWADYIAFLSRLKKALAVPAETPHSMSWIPVPEQVLTCLSLCLSPLQPSGVHQKALELYEAIFASVTTDYLNEHVSLWLAGLLSVISYGSMQVKPQLLALYKNALLARLLPDLLRGITKPLLLSLLSGLDDENSEVYPEALALLESFKAKLHNSSLFWLLFFLCVIQSPEKRTGALNWCHHALPVFAAHPQGDLVSEEAQACISPNPGLLIRAFCAALHTHSSFNLSTDTMVIRGFFDLLLSHLPLDSLVMREKVSQADKELLVMACCRVTLRKDMSLNRRLWNWLLGPDSNGTPTDPEKRKDYFTTHALPLIEAGLAKLISSNDPKVLAQGCRLTIALVMDRWEISYHVSPMMLVPILEASFKFPDNADVLSAARAFFNEVEAAHIWRYFISTLICSNTEANRCLVDFLLANFEFPEDTVNTHIPLAIVCFLSKSQISKQLLDTLSLMLDTANLAALALVPSDPDHTPATNEAFIESVKSYLEQSCADESGELAVPIPDIIPHILKNLLLWYEESIQNNLWSLQIADILSKAFSSIPRDDLISALTDIDILKTVLEFPEYSPQSPAEEVNFNTFFGFIKLSRLLVAVASPTQKSKLLRIFISNIWRALVSLAPANNQYEAVRALFESQICFDFHEIEAGILHMMLSTPQPLRISAFHKLWSYSIDISESDKLLKNALFLVLEELKGPCAIEALRFVLTVNGDVSANRLLKIITNPVLEFSLMKADHNVLEPEDDFKLFAYYIDIIYDVVSTNEKPIREALNHEFVVNESNEKMDLFANNGWSISNYKSLMLCVLEKILALSPLARFLSSKSQMLCFVKHILTVMKLYKLLLSGSETDFEYHFRCLANACIAYLTICNDNAYELEPVEANFLETLIDFMNTAKSMNMDLTELKTKDNDQPLLISLAKLGITNCRSTTVLEKWLVFATSLLYLLGEANYNHIFALHDTIIQKLRKSALSVKKFQNEEKCSDIETCISTCLSGLEDILSIAHSLLVTSKLRSHSVSQPAENGFLGNVILGVFQIESPLLKSEEEQKLYLMVAAFQDSTRVAFEIWSWAESKPIVPEDALFASQKSAAQMANRLKFRSRKILENLSAMERQEIIETILDTPNSVETKTKILHLLDNGRPELSLAQIFNSLMTRCHSQAVPDKDRLSMYSGISEKQLADFLIPYFESIDLDVLEDVWDVSILFFREVSTNASNYREQSITILHVMRVFSLKLQHMKFVEDRKNKKELATLFTSILSSAVSKKLQSDGADDELDRQSLADLMPSIEDVLQDTEKVSTAVTTVITTTILPHIKTRSKRLDPGLASLLLAIGQVQTNKAWKQVVHDLYFDSGFFKNHNLHEDVWPQIISLWISCDLEKFHDLTLKITPSSQSATANIFVWNENSEVDEKILNIKRICYLILVQPTNTFAKHLKNLISRFASALNSSCPARFRREVLLALQALTLRFDDTHLMPHWPFIIQTLAGTFSELVRDNGKLFSNMSPENLGLVLAASKLLDQMLVMRFDEFNLASWLFVADGSMTGERLELASFVDRFAAQTETILTKEGAITVTGPKVGEKATPLLAGVRHLASIGSMKRFFGLLTYINFERSFHLTEPDLEAFQADLLGDLKV